jgi:hypothetical protein
MRISKLNMIAEARRALLRGASGQLTPGAVGSHGKAIRDFEHQHMIFGWGILWGIPARGLAHAAGKQLRTLRRVLKPA